jgi:hypothetical protein
MCVLAVVASALLIIVILWDAFETIVLPRFVSHRFRLARRLYHVTWIPWSAIGRRVRTENRRQVFLSYYGPLSLLLLLSFWAVALIFGFGLLQWSLGSAGSEDRRFFTDLYLSGTRFVTLGLGDVVPPTGLARAAVVVESTIGFGFLALVIGYLPVIYQAFSLREASISLLDARAGSPRSGGTLLLRHGQPEHIGAQRQFLRDWELWSAEILESHLSFPALAYFRSQHDRQCWLAAVTVILDTSALVMAGMDGRVAHQARLTFSTGRRVVVELSDILGGTPQPLEHDRLPRMSSSAYAPRYTEPGCRWRRGRRWSSAWPRCARCTSRMSRHSLSS